jgi:hypothetical protein
MFPAFFKPTRFSWLLAAGLGLYLLLSSAPAHAQGPGPKKEEPFPFPDLEKLIPPGSIDAEQLKQLKKILEDNKEQMQKMMEELQKQFPGGAPNFKLPNMPNFPLANVERENRLGAVLQKPSATLVEQLDLPAKQGVVLKSVKADSAAAKAGLKANDILLELNGKAVSSEVDEFVKQLNDIKKDTAVDAVVMRKGKRETIKGLKLGDIPQPANPFGGLGNMPNFQLPQLPQPNFQLPQLPQGRGFGGPGGARMKDTRGPDGSFSTRYQEGDLAITITGKMDNKKADVSGIEIRDGDKTNSYKSVDDVPEDLRDDVRALIRTIEQGGIVGRSKLGR